MSEPEAIELEDPPGQRTPPAPWEQIPLSLWNDWRWQLSHRLRTAEELSRVIRLTPEERVGLEASQDGHGRGKADLTPVRPLHMAITPYFASLMDPEDPLCPIRRQVVPTAQELETTEADRIDSLNEDAHSPVPGLVHRYPDRVLMLLTTQCASYCRFCTRSRVVGEARAQFGRADHDRGLAYIAANPQIRDVLLSGGDPLMVAQPVLETILRRLREIPHVEVVRIGTRVPIFLPQRITPDLVEMLRRYHPLWMNIHVNHPREITPEVEVALARLADAGIPLGSQSVLLAGVNDCPNVLKALVHKLVRNRVRPYYLYQCDLVRGAGHFRTPVAKGLEIMEALRGHTSGFAIPIYTLDAPEGGGKVPLLPNYLLSMSDTEVVVRNYEGFISTYTQPAYYRRHDPRSCPYCRAQRDEGGQEGVAGLLSGRKRTIAPEGWEDLHRREPVTVQVPTPNPVERR